MKRQWGRLTVLIVVAIVCVGIFSSCDDAESADAEDMDRDIDKDIDIVYEKTSVEYYEAVSALIKEAEDMGLSGDSRLLIKCDKDPGFSSYEGIYRAVADMEGHYTVQFVSSGSAKEAAEKLAELDFVEYVEMDAEMSISDPVSGLL